MKYKILLAVFLCAVMLGGCSGKVDLSKVTQSTLGVNADGSIDEVVIESFDKAYYSLDELKAYVDEQAAEFNKANPQEQPENQKADAEEQTAITVHSVEVDEEQKTARLELGYLSVDLYNAFNKANLQMLTMEEALASDSVVAAGELIQVKTGETAVLKDFADQTKWHVLVADTPVQIQTVGKIMYYSKTASLIDKNTVQTTEGQSVVVFK